jgi:hypothetical protein
MCPRCIRSFRGKSGGGKGEVDDNRCSALRVWHLAMVPRVGECTCGPGGYERVEMRRGEVRKRTDVPLHPVYHDAYMYSPQSLYISNHICTTPTSLR